MDVKKNNKILEEFAKTQYWQNIDYGKRNGKLMNEALLLKQILRKMQRKSVEMKNMKIMDRRNMLEPNIK